MHLKLAHILSKNILFRAQQALREATRCFPNSCQLCGIETHDVLCAECVNQFFTANQPNNFSRCQICALPVLRHSTTCGTCINKPPAFDATFVACDYSAPLDQLILSLKFGHRLALAPMMARLMAQSIQAAPNTSWPDVIIPVPLSKERLAQRGFNQALEICKPLAKIIKLPYQARLLMRVRDTQQQTQLHPNQRHKNIKYAFSPNERYEDKIRGLHIGVVDDVITTGATLHEVAACLKRHGAARVTNYVFARTPPH